MRHLHIAELRDSWTSWLSVSLTFITINALFALLAMAGASTDRAAEELGFDEGIIGTNAAAVGINYVLCGLVGMTVVGTVTSLVVSSRRGSIARLQLAGAAPGHITSTLMSQLAVVSLASALIGDVIALAALQPVLDAQSRNQGIPHMRAVPAIGDALLANLACVGVALLGGLRAARTATRISPVEALRQAQTAPPVRKGLVGRIVWSVLVLALVALLFVSAGFAKHIGDVKVALQAVMQMTFAIIPLMAVALALLAPLTIGVVTRLWTSLVPGRSGTWHLARNTVLGKMDRLTRSVVPTMLTLGLMFGMVTLGASFMATLRAMGNDLNLSGSDLEGLLLTMGGPLSIAIAGSLSALLMMARQRQAELALDGVLGATPAQRVAIPVLEAVIVTVTALLMALVLLATEVAFMATAMPPLFPQYEIAIPWLTMAGITVVVGLATVACTVLPTLGSLRLPEPRVIARHVAA